MPISDYPSQGTIGTSQKPKRYDIEVYQGDSFEFSMTFKDTNNAAVDITGWTFKSAWKGSTGTIVAGTSNVTPTPPVTINVTNGGANGTITVLIADTSGIAEGSYSWDIQANDGTRTRTYVGGTVTVDGDITE